MAQCKTNVDYINQEMHEEDKHEEATVKPHVHTRKVWSISGGAKAMLLALGFVGLSLMPFPAEWISRAIQVVALCLWAVGSLSFGVQMLECAKESAHAHDESERAQQREE